MYEQHFPIQLVLTDTAISLSDHWFYGLRDLAVHSRHIVLLQRNLGQHVWGHRLPSEDAEEAQGTA
eukprot:4446682-Pyramimonas_sp.AAC.2